MATASRGGCAARGACCTVCPSTTPKPGMALTLAEILDPHSGQTEWLVDAPRARELEQHLTIIGAARRDARRWQIKNVSLQWSAAPAASRVPLTLKVRREG
jgi:hypothetical protein